MKKTKKFKYIKKENLRHKTPAEERERVNSNLNLYLQNESDKNRTKIESTSPSISIQEGGPFNIKLNLNFTNQNKSDMTKKSKSIPKKNALTLQNSMSQTPRIMIETPNAALERMTKNMLRSSLLASKLQMNANLNGQGKHC